MKRISILGSGAAFSLLAALLAQGCSSAEEDPDTSNNPNLGQGGAGQVGAGQGGTTSPAPTATNTTSAGQGGSPPATGQGGSPPATGQGGSPPATGQGGSPPATGTGGTGTAPPGDPGAACVDTGISDGDACTVSCTDLCGVHQLGSRLCSCAAGLVDCATCTFLVQDPLITPPTAAFPNCPSDDAAMEALDRTPGFTCPENDRCQSIRANDGPRRFCGCRSNSYDCDTKPGNFTF